MSNLISLDISKIPFSRYGSLLALFEEKKGELSVRWVARVFKDNIFNITFLYNGKKVKPEFEANQIYVKAKYRDAEAILYIHSDSSIAVDSKGFEFVFKPTRPLMHNCYGTSCGDKCFEIISFSAHFYADFKLFEGDGTLLPLKVPVSTNELSLVDKSSIMKLTCKNNKVKFIFNLSEEQMLFKNTDLNVEEDLADIEKEWLDFLSKMPEVKKEHRAFAEYSWYTLWSCTIRKSRYIPCDAVLMSKKRMCAVWSWDNCFNAMALKESLPQLSYEQFTLPYVFQSETGALPDLMSYNNEVYYGVTKPPIHGWAFEKIWDKNPQLTKEQLKTVYDAMKKQTNWWFDYRDTDGDGIPDYAHGCDSGVDNGSNFLKIGYFVESPDLPAHLILQMKTLAKLANELNIPAEADSWNERSKKLLDDFLKHSLQDGMFVSKKSQSHIYNEKSENFLNLMPLIIGEYLDKDLVRRMIKQLKERHLTEYGISSESYKNKKYYKSDGYWQGPIWAPTTYLFVDALKRLGEKQLAKEVAEKYLNMVMNVAHGNYENFDALTGKGLRAPGYSWTASVTLILMRELYLGEFD